MSKVLTFVARRDARTFATADNFCGVNGSLEACEIAAMGPAAPNMGFARGRASTTSDYTVEDKGNLLLLRSTSARAYEWLVTHTEPEAHWFGRALVVEHGYIADFVARLRFDGFSVDEPSH